MNNFRLLPNEIQGTCRILGLRIKDRFPEARLNVTCKKLIEISEDINKTSAWIKKPNYYIRLSAWFCAIILLGFIVPPYIKLKVTLDNINIADFFQMIDSSFNVIVVVGGLGFYLMSNEIKQKRRRVVTALNKLKCLAHIIDAHQLTKDPSSATAIRTANSPDRKLSDYELGRYLDYCSEMLSLIGKIAFLYIQDFNDPVANDQVNDLEALTTGLSQKIWQKIVSINRNY